MNRIIRKIAIGLALTGLHTPLFASWRPDPRPGSFDLSVLVDGAARPEFSARGTVYVEAVKGRDYELRITNPLPSRVAVALSVDGLNTIDAKHTAAGRASKWVLEPFESIVLSGWQVNGSTARRFTFTGEKRSYGAALGETQNLGLIEAVFYRERETPPPPRISSYQMDERRSRREPSSASAAEGSGSLSENGPPRAEQKDSVASMKAEAATSLPAPSLSNDYAATGMGERTEHQVSRVEIELDPHPVATIRIRYEFRNQLARLGVFPSRSDRDPLLRRESASGFDRSYCPEAAR